MNNYLFSLNFKHFFVFNLYFVLISNLYTKIISIRKIGRPGIYLDEIHVLENERRKGFGKKLLDFMVNYAKDNDYEYILWRT